jgi:hypothetical protein
MPDPARLFITLYTDEDITSELAPALRVLNTLTAGDVRNTVIYLQQFK